MSTDTASAGFHSEQGQLKPFLVAMLVCAAVAAITLLVVGIPF